MPSLIADLLDRLDVELRYQFAESAGAIEFDSGVPRDEAEALGLIDLLRTHPGALLGVTALEVEHDGHTEFVITNDLESVDRHFGAGAMAHIVDLADMVRGQFGGLAVIHQLGDPTNDN
jgi:hypothetical protein